MEWILFALLGFFFYAVTNLISKFMVTKKFGNIFTYTLLISIFGLVPLLLIPFYGITIPSLPQMVIAFVAGLLWIYALVPFYKALQMEEVSRVVPVWKFTPLFVLIFSFLFIGEVLLAHDLVAFFLLLAGGVLISIRRFKNTFRLNKSFYFVLLSALIIAASHTISKFVYMNQAYVDGFILIRFGSFLAAVPILLFPKYRNDLARTWKKMGAGAKYTVLAYGLLQFLGLASIHFAHSIGPISLVRSMGGFQSFFVLILAGLLSCKFPQIVKEEMSRGVFLQKIISIVLLILGSSVILLF